MDGQVFIAPGDITQLAAHAIACSTSTRLLASGSMIPAFRENIPGFAAWFDGLSRDREGDCHIGETFWMPLRSDVRPHGVVVVVAAGGPATAEDKAAIAVRVAIDEAVSRLRNESKLGGRLLIALPAFRFGMGGDRDHQLRSAQAQINSAREALNRHPEVDVAFIAYTPSLYRVFFEARRETLGEPSSGPQVPPPLERALIDGECVLFLWPASREGQVSPTGAAW